MRRGGLNVKIWWDLRLPLVALFACSGGPGSECCRMSQRRTATRAAGDSEEHPISSSDSRPRVIGHRGAAGLAPENTLAAFRRAVEIGVPAVEFDIQFSKDGYAMVFHDETLARMAGVGSGIRDYTESALHGFDIGFKHAPEFRGEKIPGLADLLEAVPAPIELHLELKDYVRPETDLLRRLFELLRRKGAQERTIISSPDEETLADLRKLAPGGRTALLAFRSRTRDPLDAARRADLLGCESFHPNAALATAELVDLCRRHNLKVNAFTVNDRQSYERLWKLGVDGVFTDYPDMLMAIPTQDP